MEQPNSQTLEYAAAFKSVRCAKNLLMILLLLAIVAQMACFVMVEFVGVVDELHAVKEAGGSGKEAPAGACGTWEQMMVLLLPGTKFAAVVAAALLSLTLLVGLKISLVGRLGGAAGLVGAFFWSLILLAMVTPWQQVLRGQFAVGALYNYGELLNEAAKIKPSWGGAGVNLVDEIIYYARFVAYPVVAFFVLIAVQIKWSGGFKQMTYPPQPQPQAARPVEPSAQ